MIIERNLAIRVLCVTEADLLHTTVNRKRRSNSEMKSRRGRRRTKRGGSQHPLLRRTLSADHVIGRRNPEERIISREENNQTLLHNSNIRSKWRESKMIVKHKEVKRRLEFEENLRPSSSNLSNNARGNRQFPIPRCTNSVDHDSSVVMEQKDNHGESF